jgi:hypothetical protein
MSASAGGSHQPSQSRAIPTRTVAISDAAQLPQDYCTTPGGTLFSTTPGGEPRPACPPSRLARGTACSTNSFLPAARTVCCRPCILRSGACLWSCPTGFGEREVGETDLARKPKMTGLAAPRVPRRGWHALCMPRPVLASFDSIVYFVRGVIKGWGSPSSHKWDV